MKERDRASRPRGWRRVLRDRDAFLGWILLAALICGMLLTWFWLNPLYR